MPFFLKPKTVTNPSKGMHTRRNVNRRTLKSLSDPPSTSPVPWITHLFSAAAFSSSLGQFEFITLNVNIATTLHLTQAQLVEWACALSRKWDGLDKWRGDQRWRGGRAACELSLSCFALLPWWHISQSFNEVTVVTARRVAMGDSCQSITQSEGTDRPTITLD